MDAILYRNVQLGTALPEGYHIWNRYKIVNQYSYSEPTNWSSKQQWNSTTVSVMWGKGYTFQNGYFVLSTTRKLTAQQNYVSYGLSYKYFVALSTSSAESGSKIYMISNIVENADTYPYNYIEYLSKTRISTVIGTSKGELVDSIVSNETFQNNAVNGSYWYELIQ